VSLIGRLKTHHKTRDPYQGTNGSYPKKITTHIKKKAFIRRWKLRTRRNKTLINREALLSEDQAPLSRDQECESTLQRIQSSRHHFQYRRQSQGSQARNHLISRSRTHGKYHLQKLFHIISLYFTSTICLKELRLSNITYAQNRNDSKQETGRKWGYQDARHGQRLWQSHSTLTHSSSTKLLASLPKKGT
jgi:hypothetical protein